jgi:hypothetical protein
MSRKIISFDVGIKNMAYCVFDISAEGISKIIDWNVVNLLEREQNATVHKCMCDVNIKKTKSVAASTSVCEKKAKYEKDEKHYCEMHAKKTKILMPTKSTYPSHLKKLKIGDLHKLAILYNISDVSIRDKRINLVQKIIEFFEKNTFKLIETNRAPNSNQTSLITIARSIRDAFDKITTMSGVTDVLIEHQISPIATRMMSIQGLLTQYFIMRYDPISPINVEFISSRNKLKMFSKHDTLETPTGSPTVAPTVTQKYKQHKEDSIIYTKQLMEKYIEFKKWEAVLETTKKDDLADCFLQGYWYLQTKKLIK